MTKGNYIGGHSIVGPNDNPNQIENTLPKEIGLDQNRQRYVPEFQCNGTIDGWKAFGHWMCLDVFIAAQHAAIHGDLTTFVKAAREQFDDYEQNEFLRLVNVLMIGRKFYKAKGQVKLKNTGKLGWNWEAFSSLVKAVEFTAEEENEKPPIVDDRLTYLLRLEK